MKLFHTFCCFSSSSPFSRRLPCARSSAPSSLSISGGGWWSPFSSVLPCCCCNDASPFFAEMSWGPDTTGIAPAESGLRVTEGTLMLLQLLSLLPGFTEKSCLGWCCCCWGSGLLLTELELPHTPENFSRRWRAGNKQANAHCTLIQKCLVWSVRSVSAYVNNAGKCK